MAANDKFQTHKEYIDREKRLKIKASFDKRENEKLNEIKDIDEKIEELKKQKKQKEKEYNEISTEKMQSLSMTYNNPVLISKIVEYAKDTVYSNRNLIEIEDLCVSGINSDCISMELIEKITEAETIINQEIRHTNGFNDFLNNFGSIIKLPGEGED